MDAIDQMYLLGPMEESALQGQIMGLLRELGVVTDEPARFPVSAHGGPSPPDGPRD